MNKKILMIILTVGLMLILTACGIDEYEITLNNDFSGKLQTLSLIDESMTENMTMKSNENFLNEPKLKLVSDEELEQVVDGVKMIGNKRIFEFTHISDIPDTGFNIAEENGAVMLTAPVYGVTESPEELEEAKKMWTMVKQYGYKASLTIKLPGKVLETNGTKQENNKVYWDFMNDELLAQDAMWVKFEKGSDGTDEPTEPVTPAEPAVDVGAVGGIEEAAAFLESKGILKGSEKGLELDKELTRVEGALIYARLLDLGDEIEEFTKNPDPDYIMPFNDVPDWAAKEISYLNHAGLINGISPDKFGSLNKMTADQMATLLLRAMGYSDAKGDFVWNQAVQKAVEIGMLSAEDKALIEKEAAFTRGEMSLIAYRYSQYKPVQP